MLNEAAKFHDASLNISLLTGPDLLQNLIYVPLRFRQHPYAFSAKIEGMFLQVGVLPSDQPSLRFLWLEDSTTNVVVHKYTRHRFGAKEPPHAPTIHYNALRETTSSFTRKLQKPSLKISPWTITLTERSLPRTPSIVRRSWYIFSISVDSSLKCL